MKCRFCNNTLKYIFADLGITPLSNSYLRKSDLSRKEPTYPLKAYVCHNCFLVQLDEFEKPEQIFGRNYAYFSSYSTTWLQHCKRYTDNISRKYALTQQNFVVEIASNDGCLLQFFKQKKIPVLGIEPALSVAKAAMLDGIPTLTLFFGEKTAKKLLEQYKKADLIVANNVLAHVPNLNDFIKGLKILLKSSGTITIEFPHLLNLIALNQFDTIYHEHFSYFSFLTVDKIFTHHGLRIFDVEEISTHGGSIRIHICHQENQCTATNKSVFHLKEKEEKAQLNKLETYLSFQSKVVQVNQELQNFLALAQKHGKKVIGFGAAAKGNTLLNYNQTSKSLIDYVVDNNPHKQHHFLPGTHIPIMPPTKIMETKPDYILILPWNLKNEILQEASFARSWGAKFVVPIPKLEIL